MKKEKIKNASMWTLTGILALMIVVAGYSKFADPTGWAEKFVNWGYAPWFASVIGAAEIAGGIGLLIPRTALLAALGLVIVMLGAMATHLLNGEAGSALAPLIYLAILSGIIILRRQKALLTNP